MSQLAVDLTELDVPWRALRIAMIGQKGLPATFGGIEHHVEQLGQRLAARGHHVTVFNRRSYSERETGLYRGMDLRRAPTISSKHLDAIVHSATSTAIALASRYDIIHYHALGPGIVAPIAKAGSRASIIQTIHGLDHERSKWGRGASTALRTAYWMSGHVPDRTIVVSKTLQEHYRTAFGRSSTYIPNGVTSQRLVDDTVVRQRFGLEPGQYLLFVARIVPEKALDVLLEAYRGLPGDRRLVVVGDSSFSDEYTSRVRALAAQDPRVLFSGYLYGDDLVAMYQHAGLFVQPSLMEGLPLTLLEAISYGLPVVASDIPPHLEVLGRGEFPGRRVFATGSVGSLRGALSRAIDAMQADRTAMAAFREATLEHYSWDAAALGLERVYLDAQAEHLASRRSAVGNGQVVALGSRRRPTTA